MMKNIMDILPFPGMRQITMQFVRLGTLRRSTTGGNRTQNELSHAVGLARYRLYPGDDVASRKFYFERKKSQLN